MKFQLEVSEDKFVIFPPSKYMDSWSSVAVLWGVSAAAQIGDSQSPKQIPCSSSHPGRCWETCTWVLGQAGPILHVGSVAQAAQGSGP